MRYNDGFIIATGAARDIELGFVPSWVRVVNLTDGDHIYEGPLAEVIGFDSGSVEIKAGMRVDAADGGWRGIVKQVILSGGSWAGGDAAGYIVFEPGTLVAPGTTSPIVDNDGIFASEQVDVAGVENVADVVTAGLRNMSLDISAAVAAAEANELILPYYGSSASAAKGFTIQSSVGANNELLGFQAWAPDPGSAPVDMSQG